MTDESAIPEDTSTENATPSASGGDLHFTYQSPNSQSLQQGDVLARSQAIEGLLAEVHPAYLGKQNTHFLVVTQSCDLVRRGPECKARYITLAAVRRRSDAMDREVAKWSTQSFELTHRIFDRTRRPELKRFLERLENNNHPEYFFLHSEPRHELFDESCAFLRLTVPFKSEHYDKFLEARILSLTSEFQAKLGWLVGTVYSRVGTRDYIGDVKPKKAWNESANDLLDESYAWVHPERLKEARRMAKRGELSDGSTSEVRSRIRSLEVESKKERVVRLVVAALERHDLLDQKVSGVARSLLESDAAIDKQLREA